jgi:hypothetical protein
MAKKKHFKGTGKCLIHTSREGTCGQGDTCNYVENTPPEPALPPFPEKPRGAHHVLCVSALIAYQDMYKGNVLKAITDIYRATKWCVNQAPNMKWLPLKGTYTKKNGTWVYTKIGAQKVKERGPVWKLNLPCHDWDHNCKDGWTDEVIKTLKARIWDNIEDPPAEECFDAERIKAEFDALQTEMKSALVARGSRPAGSGVGTRAAIDAQDNKDEGTWWLPFSMAEDGVAKNRVVKRFGQRPETVPEYARNS